MKVLAFETSCDDTAVAIVENGCRVLSSVRVSQVQHEDWGGVVPEIAARLHAEAWRPVLEQALAEASLTLADIDYLATTQGPGLQTSLLTGTTAASLLSQLYQIPLVPVHHIYGHIASVYLDRDLSAVAFPALVLTASGGHTEFYLWQRATEWQKLGGSLDDAVGEAFDKVAKMLGLGYPGGPHVSQRAVAGNRKAYNLPVPKVPGLDLSFAGVKAAVRRLVEAEESLSEAFVNDICASFEDVCGRIFTKKLSLALEQHPDLKTFCFVGGVSANRYLKQVFSDLMQQHGVLLMTPNKLEYSTDNAAMIAAAAYFQLQKNPSQAQVQFVEAVPRMSL